MNFKNLPIEELVEIRTKMILEKSDLSLINDIILEKEIEYSNSILREDTSATGGPAGSVSGGSVSGMGAVLSAQPSAYSGTTTSAAYAQGGGSDGSGDISVPFNATGGNKMYQKISTEMGKSHGAMTGKKSREKKLNLKTIKNMFAKKNDFTSSPKSGGKRVMNFDDFQKDNFNKVTKVNQ